MSKLGLDFLKTFSFHFSNHFSFCCLVFNVKFVLDKRVHLDEIKILYRKLRLSNAFSYQQARRQNLLTSSLNVILMEPLEFQSSTCDTSHIRKKCFFRISRIVDSRSDQSTYRAMEIVFSMQSVTS